MSSQGAKDLPQGLAEGEFASSDWTRRWTCLLRVTEQAQEEHKTPQQQAPPDMQTGQSIRACLRRGVPADHEAHSRSGDSCEESQRLSFGGSRPRRPKEGKARPWQRTTIAPHADAQGEQTRAERRHGMTSGTRPGGEEGPPWTIAGNRAEQSPTKGAVCRPSRLRLQRRSVPSDAQEWPQTRHGGVHDQPEVNALHTRST